MTIQFEIESIFKISDRNQVYVVAKEIQRSYNWKLSDDTRLGGVAIEKWMDIPRANDENGNQRLDLLAFCLKNSDDKDKLKVGEIVELIP